MMNPKVKGLFKGLKYISHVFEEEKEQEMQIGLPTDVKHVAHIGSDGPANDAPSWMKEFNSGSLEAAKEDESAADNNSVKWVSEDSKRGAKAASSPGRDIQDVPKPTRHRRNSSESTTASDSSPKKGRDSSSKTRTSRRSKESPADGSGHKSSRQSPSQASDGSIQSGNPPDVPKKSRRKKSKESVGIVGGSGRSRTKATGSNGDEGALRKSSATTDEEDK